MTETKMPRLTESLAEHLASHKDVTADPGIREQVAWAAEITDLLVKAGMDGGDMQLQKLMLDTIDNIPSLGKLCFRMLLASLVKAENIFAAAHEDFASMAPETVAAAQALFNEGP